MSALDTLLRYIAPNTTKRLEGRSRIEPVSQLDLAHYLGGGVSWTNIDIDRLTEEQEKYLASWDEGT